MERLTKKIKSRITKGLIGALIVGSLIGCGEREKEELPRNVYSIEGRVVEHYLDSRTFKDDSNGKVYYASEQGDLHAILIPDSSIIHGYQVEVSPLIKGFFSTLPDPYVTFMTSAEEQKFHEEYTDILEGIVKQKENRK